MLRIRWTSTQEPQCYNSQAEDNNSDTYIHAQSQNHGLQILLVNSLDRDEHQDTRCKAVPKRHQKTFQCQFRKK